ncbi:MAG TPA: hypothetical protein VFA32_23885 [Dehalococcoidia bacterium]|nr:hypothetical protein [Dehalococcoidia bacterium]
MSSKARILMGLRVLAIAAVVSLTLVPFGGAASTQASSDGTGAVYTLTNSPSGNEVLVYQRGGDG